MDTKTATPTETELARLRAELELATEMLARAASERDALERALSAERRELRRARLHVASLRRLLDEACFSAETGERMAPDVIEAIVGELAPEEGR